MCKSAQASGVFAFQVAFEPGEACVVLVNGSEDTGVETKIFSQSSVSPVYRQSRRMPCPLIVMCWSRVCLSVLSNFRQHSIRSGGTWSMSTGQSPVHSLMFAFCFPPSKRTLTAKQGQDAFRGQRR